MTCADGTQNQVLARRQLSEPTRLIPEETACAGMVTETGEATARFLKSIARGEIDPKETLNEQAQLGLKRVRSVRAEDRPSDCRLASRQLVRARAMNAYLCHEPGLRMDAGPDWALPDTEKLPLLSQKGPAQSQECYVGTQACSARPSPP